MLMMLVWGRPCPTIPPADAHDARFGGAHAPQFPRLMLMMVTLGVHNSPADGHDARFGVPMPMPMPHNSPADAHDALVGGALPQDPAILYHQSISAQAPLSSS